MWHFLERSSGGMMQPYIFSMACIQPTVLITLYLCAGEYGSAVHGLVGMGGQLQPIEFHFEWSLWEGSL